MVPDVIRLNFIRDRWTRPDQRHFTFQDIDELRNLVKAGTPEKLSNGRHAGIIFDFKLGFARLMLSVLFGDQLPNEFPVNARVILGFHRAEFQKGEQGAILSKPLLLEKYRPLRGELDRDGDHDERGERTSSAQELPTMSIDRLITRETLATLSAA